MNQTIEHFENIISNFFGSPYGVAVDCCTHGIELCLRISNLTKIFCPKHTYVSIPMTFEKLGLDWNFVDKEWTDYYFIDNTNIIDAAVLWKKSSYIRGTLMVLSFQYKKHLGIGRGGMILTDSEDCYKKLKKLRYDGRDDGTPWAEQNIDTLGYHYYMTPETAEIGIKKFEQVKDQQPKIWSWRDYPNISKMEVFNAK
ncbi:hypothetical protein EBU71_14990 [bacterium]|nr:hypothetical protein [Candidatus Elulimicrobium humile]